MGKLHHLKVGCADCSVIKSASHTFLVDCHEIGNHTHLLPANKNLSGVFITHQHYDHFDGLAYLKENGYSIDRLIYSPYELRDKDDSVQDNEWLDFKKYRDYFKNNGTKLDMPYCQERFDKPWWEIDGLKFFVLGPAKDIATSYTRKLHDASLVIYAELNTRDCLFTGDASEKNLKYVAAVINYIDIDIDILHASHHGSLNGANLEFVLACNPGITVVSTQLGWQRNLPDPKAMELYRRNTRKKVHRTDIDGDLEWTF